jgi:hypothetical protein
MPSLPHGAFALQTGKTTGPGCIAPLAFPRATASATFPNPLLPAGHPFCRFRPKAVPVTAIALLSESEFNELKNEQNSENSQILKIQVQIISSERPRR